MSVTSALAALILADLGLNYDLVAASTVMDPMNDQEQEKADPQDASVDEWYRVSSHGCLHVKKWEQEKVLGLVLRSPFQLGLALTQILRCEAKALQLRRPALESLMRRLELLDDLRMVPHQTSNLVDSGLAGQHSRKLIQQGLVALQTPAWASVAACHRPLQTL